MTSLNDAGFLTRWFRARAEHLDVRAPLEVTAAQKLTRGVSRETWAVDVTASDGYRRYVVRRDHEHGSVIASALETEYAVYRRLDGTGVPVTRALWFETDPDLMPDGRPAYVRELVEGDWRLPVLDDDSPDRDVERIRLSKEHIDKLALVHGVDWQDRGFDDLLPVPATPADCATTQIESCLESLAASGVEPSPVLAEAVSSLRARAPRDCDRIVLCKGTNGLGEEVWRDGRIVALSDWELAALGDPAYDFAQCQAMIPEIVRDGRRVWGMAEALEYYAQRTGTRVTADRVDYYRDLYGLLQLTYTQHAASIVRGRDDAPLRFAWTATEVAFRSELRLARQFAGDLLDEGIA